MKKTNNTKLLGILSAAVLLIAMICTFVLMAGAQEGDACASTADCTGTYENGICTECDAYESATLNAEGYYEISNAGQLYWFAAEVNGGSTNINGVLTDDIEIAPILQNRTDDDRYVWGWGDSLDDTYAIGTGIGGTTAGAFYVKTESGYVAFDETDTENIAAVQALLETYVRPWTPIGNEEYPFYGTFDGGEYTISGIYINGSDNNQGLVGISYGTVKNVHVDASLIKGESNVGGVVGDNKGTVQNSYHTGTVSGIDYVGGVVGYNSSGTVQDCYNTGTVSSTAFVGGVVGFNSSGTVQSCYNTGTVSGTESVGGVVGYNYGNVENCYNTGMVSGNFDIGGVAAVNDGTVQSSYNTGAVSGESCVGGVVGLHISGIVWYSYNTGEVSGESAVGGVVGKNESNSVVESCYYLSDSETDELDGTTAKTAAQFASCEVCEGVGFHVFGDNGLCLVCNGGFEQPEQNEDGTYLIQPPPCSRGPQEIRPCRFPWPAQ